MTLVFSLILTYNFLSCTSDMKEMDQPTDIPEETDTMMAAKPIKYLALGDSYTIGESVSEAERWPTQLQKFLLDSGVKIEKPVIIAKTGWTTNELKDAIEKASPKNEYQLVSLLIGVNNQYRGYPLDQQKKEFRELLLQAIGFAQGDTSRVFVVSIPDYGVTPFGQSKDPEKIAKEIDEYNSVNYAICREYGVTYFDITENSRAALNDGSLIAEDGLHPSGKMYSQWVYEIIGSVILENLD